MMDIYDTGSQDIQNTGYWEIQDSGLGDLHDIQYTMEDDILVFRYGAHTYNIHAGNVV